MTEAHVRALHAETPAQYPQHAYTGREADKAITTACSYCGTWWPCATIEALDEPDDLSDAIPSPTMETLCDCPPTGPVHPRSQCPHANRGNDDTLRCIYCQRTITYPATEVWPSVCLLCGRGPGPYTAERRTGGNA